MDLKTYYETYSQTHVGSDLYKLENYKDTSRVMFLQHYVRTYAKPGDRILDIGCGDMYLARSLPEYNWVGLDIATDLSPDTIKCDLMVKPYPLPDQYFDMVICSEVLEHVWDPRIINQESKRLLKPGGHYVISTPNFDCIDHTLSAHGGLVFNPKWGHIFEHIRHYNYESLEKLLISEGFVIKDYAGADAHCVHFFQEAREYLHTFFKTILNKPITEGSLDMMLGQMFRKTNATILIVSQNEDLHKS